MDEEGGGVTRRGGCSHPVGLHPGALLKDELRELLERELLQRWVVFPVVVLEGGSKDEQREQRHW